MAATPAKRRPARANKADTQKSADPKPEDKHAGTSPWEWAVAAVGAAILAFIVGYLVYEAIARPPEPRPEIVVTGDAAVQLANGTFLVPIEVRNLGHATGAGVNVSGTLLGEDGAVIEESAVSFDFVAPHSRESGGLYFAADPATARLVLRVEGFADP